MNSYFVLIIVKMWGKEVYFCIICIFGYVRVIYFLIKNSCSFEFKIFMYWVMKIVFVYFWYYSNSNKYLLVVFLVGVRFVLGVGDRVGVKVVLVVVFSKFLVRWERRIINNKINIETWFFLGVRMFWKEE